MGLNPIANSLFFSQSGLGPFFISLKYTPATAGQRKEFFLLKSLFHLIGLSNFPL